VLSAVIAFVVLLVVVAGLGFLADRPGDGPADLDVRWRPDELRRRLDRADAVPAGGTRAAVLVVVGAGLATLALLTAPFVALPFVEGGTLPAALGLLESYAPAVDVLWALPMGTALIAFAGFRLLVGADRGARWCHRTSAGIVAGGGVVLVVLLGLLLVPGPAASWITTDGGRVAQAGLQAGYYLCVSAVAAALIGALAVVRELPVASRA
jgi:mannitol-specific phosphotransferase system IIBC component